MLERGPGLRGSLAMLRRELTPTRVALGLTAFLFAATGPLVILLTTANSAHLPFETTVSWIFIVYFSGGISTLLLSLYYRQPVMVAWSIPGAAIVADALARYPFSDVLGAYLVLGLIVVVMGLSGLVRWVMRWLPVPVLLGMVAAVLLPYGQAVFSALVDVPVVALPTLAIYLFLAAFPHLGRRCPPIVGAIIVMLALSTLTGSTHWGALQPGVATPKFFWPSFNLATIIELVPPLGVAVLAIQNGQGTAVLLSQGYEPPINSMTFASGLACLLNSFFGGHQACVAGPTIAIAGGSEGGPREGRFSATFVAGVCWVGLSIIAPVAASIDKVVLRKSLIPMLGGLAMLNVLVGTLMAAFAGPFRNGALFAFLITLSDIKVAGIGSAFWGLLGGMLAAIVLDNTDFRKLRQEIRAERLARLTLIEEAEAEVH
ncbi:MAG TPA: benzoate/H(+) symporter BenE family transporter [Chloroflexia bacterium]|nr:benzoate/H(+) symporter BenE family transporter [Chloroflexia bacterium]